MTVQARAGRQQLSTKGNGAFLPGFLASQHRKKWAGSWAGRVRRRNLSGIFVKGLN